jgi:heme exporter protein B
MNLLYQAKVIARTDLRTEGRSGEILWIVLPYGALALFLIPIATSLPAALLREIGFGMYWVVVLLFGMFITLRQSAQSTQSQKDLFRLTLLDPAALFLGRSLASTTLLVGFQAVMAPVTLTFFSPAVPENWGLLILVGILLAVAMGMTGTLVGLLVSGTRSSTALAPLLAAGLAFPSLVGASLASIKLGTGESIVNPIALLVLVVLVTTVIGVTSASLLED